MAFLGVRRASPFWLFGLFAALTFGSAGRASAETTLEEKMAVVLPSKDEDRWLEINWHTNIAEARAEAQREGKPLLLWVMNGNPLGCA